MLALRSVALYEIYVGKIIDCVTSSFYRVPIEIVS